MEMEPIKDKRGVESVEVAGMILQAMVGFGGAVRIKDLEVATGIPSAKIHRYLVSLARSGLVRRLEGGNRYHFGLLAYQIGQLASHGNDLVAMVGPVLSDYTREVGETCGIAVWLDQGATILRWYEADRDISITLKPATRVTLTASSTGKLFGACLPREMVEPLVAAELEQGGLAGPSHVEAVFAEYAEIRRRGISQGKGVRIRGINTLSVPVFDAAGRIVCGITMLGHESTFAADPDSPVARSLVDLGRRLSRMTGGGAHPG